MSRKTWRISQRDQFLILLMWGAISGFVVDSFEIPLPGGGRVKFESGGVVRIRLDQDKGLVDLPPIPPIGTPADPSTLSSIEIRDTGTIKGYGAFCCTPILPKHSFLGFYEGQRIESREELDKMVSSSSNKKRMDYVMSIDGGYTFIDGYEMAQSRDIFNPSHLNHEDRGLEGCNCVRILEDGRVAFFTSRDILQDEELCFDYGTNFWKGREDEKV